MSSFYHQSSLMLFCTAIVFAQICRAEKPVSRHQQQPAADIKQTQTKKTASTSAVKYLLTFEKSTGQQEKAYHNLTHFTNQGLNGRRSAVLRLGQYNQINLNKTKIGNWQGYDYLCFNIYNPTSQKISFAACVQDQLTGGYWNRLNIYSKLNSGWNRLRFKINRYVGERGSVRIKRYLNLAEIKRFWFAIDPETRRHGKIRQARFLVDAIWLEKAPPAPERFKGLKLFDFVKEKFRAQRGFIPITTHSVYNKKIGYGFSRNTKIWRALDSLYADNLHRDAIMVNHGKFLVDLPDGQYIVRLVPFQLGLWNEHFWTHRKIVLQGKVILDEKRSSAKDYLQNFLRFQDIEPTPKDNPFDLYLQKIFKPIIKIVTVDNGQLELAFEADNSGIALNSLIIYPVNRQTAGERFIARLRQVQKNDFMNMCRLLPPPPVKNRKIITDKERQRGFYTALIPLSTQVRYNSIFKSQGNLIQLCGGRGQRPSQAVMVRNLKEQPTMLRISCPPLIAADGTRINVNIRRGVEQYMSHSFNHETFELAPRFLRRFPAKGRNIAGKTSLLLWIQTVLNRETKPGTYKGAITFTMHDASVSYPITLTVYPFTLPDPDIAVGYFGLDPVRFSYYPGNRQDISATRQRLRYAALKIIRAYGYTTWSSLPDGQFVNKEQQLEFQAPATDALMSTARRLGFKHKIFSYGGSKFLQLDNRNSILGLSNKKFRHISAAILQQHLKKYNWLPLVIDYSDEAAGYSHKVARDLARSEVMKRFYPFLRRGGYTHAIAKGEYGYKLNQDFTDPSVSSYSREFVKDCKNNHIRWGLYNVAIGLFENGRPCFGEALFVMTRHGADHLLEWYLTLNQNYPYYDLDGRECDAMMLFPRRDGQLDSAIKFELNSQGLEDYRLLLLLERLAEKAGPKGATARNWLKENYYDVDIFKTANYMNQAKSNYSAAKSAQFRKKIYQLILTLTP